MRDASGALAAICALLEWSAAAIARGMSTLQPPPSLPKRVLIEGMAAARANLVPGLILNFVAVIIGCGYAWHEPTRAALTAVGDYKQEVGILFPIVSTAFFAGLLPVVMQRLGAAHQDPWGHLRLLLPFWAYKGAEVNALYDLQAMMFGTGTDIGTLACKVAFDQFVYVPIWAVPSMVIAYQYMNTGFSWQALRADLNRSWYVRRCSTVLVMNMLIWVPAVTMIYTLPTALQLPIQNIIACLFVLLISFMTKPVAPAVEV